VTSDVQDARLAGGLVIRGGQVLTMDGVLGDLDGGDVLIGAGGAITSVGRDLAAPGVPEIDARGMIVAPGLVDTHWHMWNTLLRGMSGEYPRHGYFRSCAGYGRWFGPEDIYAGTLLACAEAIYSGITTVHDWCHNVRTLPHAQAGLRALAEAGLRGRFSWGYPAGQPGSQPVDLAGLAALRAGWAAWSAGGLLSLGMAWRGTGGSDPSIAVPPGLYRAEIGAARELGLPVTVHACGPRTAAGQIATLGRAGLLGPDLQIVHANAATEEEVALLAEAGCPVSVAPYTELLIGYGMPRTAELAAAGLPVGLSVDTTMLSGNADMFAVMKITQGITNALSEHEFELTARDALALGTIEGARSLGLDAVTGSLTPGKRADVIIVACGAPNIGVLTDPAQLLVTAAQPANVDTVIADGRVLKRGGVLTSLDPAEVSHTARAALAGVRARAAAP